MSTINTTTERISFSSVKRKIQYPDFLSIQIKSFQEFLHIETQYSSQENQGIFKTFMEIFPIFDSRNQFVLEFLDYFIDSPRYSIKECIERGLTFSVPLKARMCLYCADPERENFETVVQDVYLGAIPHMTPSGSFIINGAERVIVSQLHRSPGVFFGQSLHTNGMRLYSARVIPFKGSWIEFSTDINNVMYAYVDRKKKFTVTTLFRAIGYEEDKDILGIFDLAEEVKVRPSNFKRLIGSKIAVRVLKKCMEDFVDENSGEVISIQKNENILERDIILEKEHIADLMEAGIESILLHKKETSMDSIIIHNTLQRDPTFSGKEALEKIYRQLRNSDPLDEETSRGVIDKLFFSETRS